jgi:hypothetical protein
MSRNERIDWITIECKLKFNLNNRKSQTKFVDFKNPSDIMSNIIGIDFKHRYGKNNLSKKMDVYTVYVVQDDIKSVFETESGCIFR